MMKLLRLDVALVVLFCAGVFPGCSEPPKSPPPPDPDLTGKWSLVMPAGFKYEAPIEYMGNLRYRIAVEINLGGVYEIAGNRLTMMNPAKEGTRHYVWKIEDKNSLILLEAPTVGEVGSDYRGAVLNRLDGDAE